MSCCADAISDLNAESLPVFSRNARAGNRRHTPYARELDLNSESSKPDGKKNWESVHICPQCHFAVNLSQIDLKTVTTGIVECPRCEWAGPIEIQIVEVDDGTE
jgi:hypothetical protein